MGYFAARTWHSRRLWALSLAVWLMPVRAWPANELEVQTKPVPLVVGKTATTMEIELRGLAGSAPVHAAVNLGTIQGIEARGELVRLRLQPPAEPFPFVLCIVLWREGAGDQDVRVIRLPVLARTVLPVETRPNSVITIAVGRRLFGPHDIGPRGQRRVRLLIAPEDREATVQVTDKAGLETRKRIPIEPRPFNKVTLATAAGPTGLRVIVGLAEPRAALPQLEVAGKALALREVAPGHWAALWVPPPGEPARIVVVRTWLKDQPVSTRQLSVEWPRNVAAAKPSPPVVKEQRPAVRQKHVTDRTWLAVLGASVGMVYNAGDVLAPRFGAELGLERHVSSGRIGARLLCNVSWSHQAVTESSGEDRANELVVAMPLSALLSYHLSLPHLTPYVSAGALVEMVHSSAATDWVIGGLGMLGLERELGPGALFVQTGVYWGRVENTRSEIFAGGFFVDAGYRFHL